MSNRAARIRIIRAAKLIQMLLFRLTGMDITQISLGSNYVDPFRQLIEGALRLTFGPYMQVVVPVWNSR